MLYAMIYGNRLCEIGWFMPLLSDWMSTMTVNAKRTALDVRAARAITFIPNQDTTSVYIYFDPEVSDSAQEFSLLGRELCDLFGMICSVASTFETRCLVVRAAAGDILDEQAKLHLISIVCGGLPPETYCR